MEISDSNEEYKRHCKLSGEMIAEIKRMVQQDGFKLIEAKKKFLNDRGFETPGEYYKANGTDIKYGRTNPSAGGMFQTNP